MANKLINVDNISYCGKEAQDIFTQDIYGIDLRSYGITFMDGVKGKTKAYSGQMGDVWQPYTCPFTPEGNVELGETYLEPAEIKVNMEECYDVFWNTFLVEQTKIALDGGIPQTFSEWFFGQLRQKMDKEYQEIFWQGDSAYTGTTKQFLKVIDGIEKKLGDDAENIQGAVFTVSNVVAQVEAAVMKSVEVAATNEVDSENYKIFMNYNDVRLLEVALGKDCCGTNSTNAIFKNYAKNGDKIVVMGYEVVPTMQSRNTVIVGPANNLILGFDTEDSRLTYKLIDMRETNGDNMFRVIALSNIAVGVVLPSLFVYSHV